MFGLRGDNVTLFVSVKVHDALDGDVVRFGGAGGKDDFFRRGVDKRRDLGPGGLDGVFGFPAIVMSPGVRVTELREVEGEHSVQNPRVDRCGSLHIQVERSTGYFDAFHGDSRWILMCVYRWLHNGGRRGETAEVRGGERVGLAEFGG